MIDPRFVNKDTPFQSHYDINCQLGTGAFGEVWQCTHKNTKATRAVKIIPKTYIPIEGSNDLINHSLFEASILLQLDHPNILKIYSVYEDSAHVFIVMEYLKGSELLDHIIKFTKLSEYQAAHIMKQLLYAVNYSHLHHVMHMYCINQGH